MVDEGCVCRNCRERIIPLVVFIHFTESGKLFIMVHIVIMQSDQVQTSKTMLLTSKYLTGRE